MRANWNISKLRQKLRAWNLAPESLSPRQRRLAWILGGFLAVAAAYLLVISPILTLQEEWAEELARKRQLLARYQALQGNKARLAQADQALKTTLATLEGQFLTGANPAVAAADLQEIVKSLAETHGLQITSTKILSPQESGPYVEVPIQVQLSSTMDQLTAFLFHLEHHKKLLFIAELEVNAPRRMVKDSRTPPMHVNLVVLGVIKKRPPA